VRFAEPGGPARGLEAARELARFSGPVVAAVDGAADGDLRTRLSPALPPPSVQRAELA